MPFVRPDVVVCMAEENPGGEGDGSRGAPPPGTVPGTASGTVPASLPPMAELLCDPSLGAQVREVEAPTVLYEPEAPARDLYFIQSGQVRTFLPGRDGAAKEGAARLVEILGPGDWFGVPALAGSAAYGSRAVAVARAAVCQLPVDRLMAHLPHMPAVAAELIRQLARKLQAAHEDAANLVFEDTYQRLVKTLLQFSRTAAASPQEGGDVVLRITHQQLAQAVGAARETVSLTLTQLRQQNLLRTGRNRLWFNPTALEEFAKRDQAGPADKSAAAAAATDGAVEGNSVVDSADPTARGETQ